MSLKTTLCLFADLPLTDYEEALELQRWIVTARKEKRFNEDIILIVEHPPVFTLGRNGGRENLVVSESFLSQKGIRVVQIERGGNITYHGPGQLVAYPVLDLKASRLGVEDYVSGLEDIMIRTVKDWGIKASGNPENRGAWVGNNKLGSIGVSISRGISFHGLGLNVNTSLEPFTWINPCGFNNIRMTSMKTELSQEISMEEVRDAMKNHMASFLGRKLVQTDLTGLRKFIQQQ